MSSLFELMVFISVYYIVQNSGFLVTFHHMCMGSMYMDYTFGHVLFLPSV